MSMGKKVLSTSMIGLGIAAASFIPSALQAQSQGDTAHTQHAPTDSAAPKAGAGQENGSLSLPGPQFQVGGNGGVSGGGAAIELMIGGGGEIKEMKPASSAGKKAKTTDSTTAGATPAADSTEKAADSTKAKTP